MVEKWTGSIDLQLSGFRIDNEQHTEELFVFNNLSTINRNSLRYLFFHS